MSVNRQPAAVNNPLQQNLPTHQLSPGQATIVAQQSSSTQAAYTNQQFMPAQQHTQIPNQTMMIQGQQILSAPQSFNWASEVLQADNNVSNSINNHTTYVAPAVVNQVTNIPQQQYSNNSPQLYATNNPAMTNQPGDSNSTSSIPANGYAQFPMQSKPMYFMNPGNIQYMQQPNGQIIGIPIQYNTHPTNELTELNQRLGDCLLENRTKLEKFNGDISKYAQFKTAFLKIYSGSRRTDFERFLELKAHTFGEPLDLISGYYPCDASYNAAWAILDKTYASSLKQANHLILKLKNQKIIKLTTKAYLI